MQPLDRVTHVISVTVVSANYSCSFRIHEASSSSYVCYDLYFCHFIFCIHAETMNVSECVRVLVRLKWSTTEDTTDSREMVWRLQTVKFRPAALRSTSEAQTSEKPISLDSWADMCELECGVRLPTFLTKKTICIKIMVFSDLDETAPSTDL